MNLRPKIAAEIVEALLDDLKYLEPVRSQVRERWVEVALSKFTSHSIEFPKGEDGYSSSLPVVIEAFLTKYPRLRTVLEDVRAKADELNPGVDLRLEVTNDPEGCHTCHEGQTLVCEVLFTMSPTLGLNDPEWKAKREALDSWWGSYPGSYGPDREEVLGVFLVMVKWNEEPMPGAGDLPPSEGEAL